MPTQSPSISDLKVQIWPTGDIVPYAKNSRTHTKSQISKIAASIQEWGWTNPILAGANKEIIAGHARLEAAKLLKMESVPVIVLGHLTDEQRRALVIADNQLAMSAGWDEELLREELLALKDLDYNLDLIGFDDVELKNILEVEVEEADEDSVPELVETITTRQGDMWLCGSHKVLCGDSTKAEDVSKLLPPASVDMVFTDPPYNVGYEGGTAEAMTILNDKMDVGDFIKFLEATFQSYRTIVKPGAALYVCHPSSFQREFQNALEASGFTVRTQIIWAKNTFAWGFGRYKFQHEPIFYAYVTGQKDSWYGDKTQSTLWNEKKPAANKIHPTTKPVELIDRALVNSSKAGDTVADLFGGSGSTMIACERRERVCRSIELDPKYVDRIVRRWQEFTGKKATLEETTKTFEEVAEARKKGEE